MDLRAVPTPASSSPPGLAVGAGLFLVMIGGAVLGFLMHWDRFGCSDLHKPFVSILALSWFPLLLPKLHRIRSRDQFLGFAILLAFIGWDAMARIVDRGWGC